MKDINVAIITKSGELPEMKCTNFFHSTDLFKIIENTPGQRPMMAIASIDGNIVAHIMMMLRRRGSLFPPYLFSQARAYGEGEYEKDIDKEQVFGCMLKAIIRKLRYNLCLYIEFSDLSSKMFAYKEFRLNSFFPVRWMSIHNSLHSMEPEKRLTERIKKHLRNADKAGLETMIATTGKECHEFYHILKHSMTLSIRRYIPDIKLFEELIKAGKCNLFVTKNKSKTTGGCVCVYSDNNCYLWYLAVRKKLFFKRTNAITIWAAIKHAYANGYQHIYFMDVGLPYKKNPLREFILSFGGKPVGTYRWFRCSISWINSLLSWSYRE